MKNNLSILILIVLMFSSCGQGNDMEVSDCVDHWEIKRTFEIYNNSRLKIDTLDNKYQVDNGMNQVLIITIERNPVFKEGKELTDLYSIESLLIELDSSDNLVTTERPSNSKLFRKLIAFSPDHGITPLDSTERMVLIRKNSTIWEIQSKIRGFEFNAELDFNNRQSLTTKYIDY